MASKRMRITTSEPLSITNIGSGRNKPETTNQSNGLIRMTTEELNVRIQSERNFLRVMKANGWTIKLTRYL